MPVSSKFLPAQDVLPYKELMWQLYKQYHTQSIQVFFNHIPKHSHYILFFDQNNLIGFSGINIHDVTISGSSSRVLYLSQTLVHPDYRSQRLIQKVLIGVTLKHLLFRPWQRLYYAACMSSYRAYLSYLNVLTDLYPRRNAETPPELKAVLNQLGAWHYADNYNPKTLCGYSCTWSLRDPDVQPKEKDWAHPDIRYFLNSLPEIKPKVGGYGLMVIGRADWKMVPRQVLKLVKLYTGKFRNKLLRVFPKQTQISTAQ